jgi:hypothetical protein
MTSVDVLERLTRVTPLGVRFLDVATGAYVTGALSVEVYPKGEPERRTRAAVNRTSVFVCHDLPSLSQIERGEGDAAFWTAETPRYPFVLDVRDGDDRFLPFTLDVLLPARRLLGIAFNSPVSSPLASQTSSSNESLPLFSSPARDIPDAMGALRAEIVDSGTGSPAAWALVEARGPGQPMATGLADIAGRVMVPLLYPKPVVTLGSPGSPSLPVTAQTWTIDVTVRYSRPQSIPAVPDLAAVLAQPAATVWGDVARTAPLTQGTLRFGRDLVLASVTGAGTPSSTLLITPAGSPL